MAQFTNRPVVHGQDGAQQIKRYVHSPLTIDHHGIKASIKSNGKVDLSKVAGPDPDNKDDVLIDEIEIPASLIFKLASLLRATRTVQYVSMAEIKPGDLTSDPEKVN